MKILLCILLALPLSACLSTTDVYETARKVNDDTFISSVNRFCGSTAYLAANRHLTDAEIIKRYDFCLIYNARSFDTGK